MKNFIIILLITFLPMILLCQTQMTGAFPAGGGVSSNAEYTNFSTFGQPFGSTSTNSSYTNLEGFINAQHVLPNIAYISDDYNSVTVLWGYNHFSDLDNLIKDCVLGAEIHLSNYNHTGNVDMTGYKFIIDTQDFILHGNLAGGLIQATNTGYLVLDAAQNTEIIFPVTDTLDNLSLSITCLNAPTNPIKVKINHFTSSVSDIMNNFWDISGDNNLNATLLFNIPKTALTSGVMESTDIIRFWNGTRYIPIPQDQTTIEDMGTYYKVTTTAINQF